MNMNIKYEHGVVNVNRAWIGVGENRAWRILWRTQALKTNYIEL
jgi:hypothetical protein